MELFKTILDNLTSGILTLSKDGVILYLNPMAKKILHIPKEIENTHYKESLSSLPGLVEVIDDMIKNNRTQRRAEVMIVQGNFYLRLGYSSMPVKEGQNHIGYTIIFQDLSIIYENR